MRTVIATVCLLAIVAPVARAKVCSPMDPSSCPDGSQCRRINRQLHPECIPNSVSGLARDSKRDARPTINPACWGRPRCLMLCPKGLEFARDQDGCEICKCVPKTDQDVGKRSQLYSPSNSKRSKICRDIPLCKMYCAGGYKKDKNGCALCACKIDTSGLKHVGKDGTTETPIANVGKRSQLYSPPNSKRSKICREIPLCKMYCAGGYKKDKNGCALCACNIDTSGLKHVGKDETTETPIADVGKRSQLHAPSDSKRSKTCLGTPICKKYCPGGFKKDKNGCALCSCKWDLSKLRTTAPQDTTQMPIADVVGRRSVEEPETPKMCMVCAMYCPLGNKMGKDGCPLCECNTPSDLPPLDEVKDEGDSEVVPAEDASMEEAKRGIADWYCGDVPLCTLACPNGYKKDKKGCAKCACKTSGFQPTTDPDTAITG